MAENETWDEAREESLAAELQELGRNLSRALRTAWDSPERKKLQDEVANGLTDLGNRLRDEAAAFSQSPTGQRLKEDVGELRERSRGTERRARSEILEALKKINTELEKTIAEWSKREEEAAGAAQSDMPEPEDHREVHPDDVEAPPSETGHEEIHPDDVDAPPPPGQD